MDPNLRNILSNYCGTTSSEKAELRTLFGSQNGYYILDGKHTDFWYSYCKLVNSTLDEDGLPDKDSGLCLAEIPDKQMPLILDFVLRFNNTDDEWEIAGMEFLVAIIGIAQDVLANNFELTAEHNELVVAIQTSTDSWTEESESILCYQIRLQFPYCRLDKQNFQKVFMPKYINKLRSQNVRSLLERDFVGDWKDIIDADIHTKPIVMYGSGTILGRPKLDMKYIMADLGIDGDYNFDPREIDPQLFDFKDAFLSSQHSHVSTGLFDETIFKSVSDDDVDIWVPMFLSLHFGFRIIFPKQASIVPRKVTPMRNLTSYRSIGSESDMDELTLAETMMQMLKPERFADEPTFLDIGRALYYSDDGDVNGLNSWIRAANKNVNKCKEYPHFLANTSIDRYCSEKYELFTNDNITVKTLAWFAREDNFEQYREWHDSWCYPFMQQALNCTDNEIAQAFYHYCWLDFIFSPNGKGRWFVFSKYRWEEAQQSLQIAEALSGRFLNYFEKARLILAQDKLTNKNDQDKIETTIGKIHKLISSLRSNSAKNRVIRESCIYFRHVKIDNLLNSNANLTGVNNGVLEVCGNSIKFRNAKPEDYISRTTGIKFIDYDLKSPTGNGFDLDLVKLCYKWVSQIFVPEDIRHYFLKFAASFLYGRNAEKLLTFFTGSGDNSKSMLIKLFEATLGPYTFKLPNEVFSSKNTGAANASPHMARAENTRAGFVDEGDEKNKLDKSKAKKLTGGDSFFARKLYDNGSDLIATFKLVYSTNGIPIFENPDRATKNRIVIMPFLSTWVYNPPASEEEQFAKRMFPRDDKFDRMIPLYAPVFLWLMYKWYPYYASEGLVKPQIIIDATEKYWCDSDLYAQFIADNIQMVDGANAEKVTMSINDIYSMFKEWHARVYPGSRIPDRGDVKADLTNRWGPATQNHWSGIKPIGSAITEGGATSTVPAMVKF